MLNRTAVAGVMAALGLGSGVVRRAMARVALSGGSRYARDGVARLRPGGFPVPAGFAPTARVALNRGQGGLVAVKHFAVKHSGRAGTRVTGSGTPAPSKQSIAADYLNLCDGPTLRVIAHRRISELEGFVNGLVREARNRGKIALADSLEVATGRHLDVDTKGLLDALEKAAKNLRKKDLRISSVLATARAELFDVACRAAGVRGILRKSGGF